MATRQLNFQNLLGRKATCIKRPAASRVLREKYACHSFDLLSPCLDDIANKVPGYGHLN